MDYKAGRAWGEALIYSVCQLHGAITTPLMANFKLSNWLMSQNLELGKNAQNPFFEASIRWCQDNSGRVISPKWKTKVTFRGMGGREEGFDRAWGGGKNKENAATPRRNMQLCAYLTKMGRKEFHLPAQPSTKGAIKRKYPTVEWQLVIPGGKDS